MKKNKRNLLLIIIIGLLLFIPLITRADSGWDTDYGGGSSSSSSSESSSSSSNHGSGFDITDMSDSDYICLFCLFIFSIVFFAFGQIITKSTKKSEDNRINRIKEFTEKYNLNEEKIGKKAYDIFVNVQNGWMNFDYKTLEQYCSDELYNTYKMQLEALNIKGQKNIMEDITYVNSYFYDININDKYESITVVLTIRMKDYVVDSKGNVVRGDKKITYENSYYITIVRNTGSTNSKCPNCNAELGECNHHKCRYCGSIIINSSNKFAMSKKAIINQNTYRIECDVTSKGIIKYALTILIKCLIVGIIITILAIVLQQLS